MAQLDSAQEVATQTLVRAPKQDRSRRTLKRILDAGLYLVEHERPDSLTVTAITKRARTSVGSFYARFEGKDDLLKYLGERALAEAVEVWTELTRDLTAGGSLRGSVTDAVQRLGWLYLEGAGRSLILLDGIEDPSPTRRTRLEDRIAGDLRRLLDAPWIRSDLATRVLTGILQDAAVRSLRDGSGGESGQAYPEPPVLLTELVELLVGYLGGDGRGSERSAIAATEPELTEPFETEPRAVATAAGESKPVSESPAPAPAVSEEKEQAPGPRPGEIATEALIEAALVSESTASSPAPPEPGPEHELEEAPEAASEASSEDESQAAPEPRPEAEPDASQEPIPEPEPEAPEALPSADPDPFDVWG